MASTPTPDLLPQGWDAAADAYDRMIAHQTARYAADALRLADVRAGARVRAVTVLSDPVREALPELPPPDAPPAVFSLRDPKQIEREMKEAGLRDVRVETVTHAFTFATPETVWTDFAPASPVFASLLD